MDEIDGIGGGALAYLGDTVIEITVREKLVKTGIRDVGELNRMSRDYVTAKNQSKALEKILPALDEEETAIYKRGRNAHGVSIPKSASANEYRRATGMEALFGWLYLKGRNERIREIFEIGFGEE